MQFISNGPDIPEALLQAQEEGRAVFFCGAGISFSAGLPSFKELADKIHEQLGTTLSEVGKDAYDKGQFDITLNLLEQDYPGGRVAVRNALEAVLEPKLRRRGAMDTHAALLQLARSRDGKLKLVTTNFDRIFEHAAKRIKKPHNTYAAPTLPVPKASRWDGLVHLHGQLPSKLDENALQRLVVTSGDFGLAYLTERWAARFVAELFRNYVVCFVGYSINDPMMRYLMDALAADRMLGETSPRAYAFGDFEIGQQSAEFTSWNSKGVTPILYQLRSGRNPHFALQQTLKVWAETYRDGISGKEQIVVQHALAQPASSTRQDDFVGRVLWAISDPSGLPAKRFAELNPAPPIEWLKAFSEKRFRYDDLGRFGMALRPPTDTTLQFSLVNRPANYKQAPWMALDGVKRDPKWDDVMRHIANWLARFLNDPQLIHWMLDLGKQPHDQMLLLVKSKLDHFDRLLSEGKHGELNRILGNSPHAIPDEPMRALWNLLLRGRVKSSENTYDLIRWMKDLKRGGLSSSLRLKLRDLLSPVILLRRPIRWPYKSEMMSFSEDMGRVADWELALVADLAHSTIRNNDCEQWREALPALLDDLQQLLRDALDLLRELGGADDLRDGSYWQLPSIDPHGQNRNSRRDWVVLIELLRDAWLAVKDEDPAKAIRIAEQWFDTPYATFKRLALYAASKDGLIDAAQWSGWLLSDSCWWLWSVETRREVMRLLEMRGHNLSSSQEMMETAILDGPPRHMYGENLEPEKWKEIVDQSVWLRLEKLNASDLVLGNTAQNRLNALSEANPSWKLHPHGREEFPVWMSGTGYPDYEEDCQEEEVPENRHDLVRWLKSPLDKRRRFDGKNWQDACRSRFSDCLYALRELSKEETWPTDRWQEALQVWSEKDQTQQSWKLAGPLVCDMPKESLQEIARGVAWWLDAASKAIEEHEREFLELCQRILDLQIQYGPGTHDEDKLIERPVIYAINHPVGLVTQAVLTFWLGRDEPNDDDGLTSDIKALFTEVCEIGVERFRNGRAVLASNLITLFRVDRLWTEKHLLPLFQWSDNPTEAHTVWEGFLRSPRLYQPLLIAIKPQFLDTARHFNKLAENGDQYVALLTHAALGRIDGIKQEEFRLAFRALTQKGLVGSSGTLAQALDSAGEQREEYWTNRVRPFWQKVWPKSRELVSNEISEQLAYTSIASRGKFEEALNLFRGWLRPIEFLDHVVYALLESNLCASSPNEALHLLASLTDNQTWSCSDLMQCISAISQADPKLQNDPRFERLRVYATNE